MDENVRLAITREFAELRVRLDLAKARGDGSPHLVALEDAYRTRRKECAAEITDAMIRAEVPAAQARHNLTNARPPSTISSAPHHFICIRPVP
jgi:hypothetical protein